MCFKEIKLHAQSMSIIVGSIVNISGWGRGGGEPYNHLMCKRI